MSSFNNYLITIEDTMEMCFFESIKKLLNYLKQTGVIPPNYVYSKKYITTTSSSGNSVCIIFKNFPVVYQIYPNRHLYERMKSICKSLILTYENSNGHYITHHKDFIEALQCITYQKIEPINQFGFNYEKMKEHVKLHIDKIKTDVQKSLKVLHEHTISHGDPTIDNIGFNSDTGNYVLFDYDKSKSNCSVFDMQKDQSLFEISLQHYLI